MKCWPFKLVSPQQRVVFFVFHYQKADDKIFVYKFSKMSSTSYIILRIQRLEGKSDEVAHSEALHVDLRCLQIQLFSSLVLSFHILQTRILCFQGVPYLVFPSGITILE